MALCKLMPRCLPLARVASAVVYLVAAAAVTFAVDLDQPARVRVRVRDKHGRPVPGAIVTVSRGEVAWDERHASFPGKRHVPDAEGRVSLELRRPEEQPRSSACWRQSVRIEAEGYSPGGRSLRPFPGAEFELNVVLERRRTTLIRVVGPGGEPVPYVGLTLSVPAVGAEHPRRLGRAFTDEKGKYVFAHVPLQHGFQVTVGRDASRWPFGARWRRSFGDVAEAVVALPADELPHAFPRRRLEGRLVGPDGGPARGWSVAQAVEYTGSAWGVPMTPASMTDNYSVAGLLRTGSRGEFVVASAGDRLCVVSPRGIPFMYQIAPESWPKGTRRIILRLPPLRRLHRGRLRHKDGTPVQGFTIAANRVRFGSRYSVSVWEPSKRCCVRPGKARTLDGSPIRGLATDAEGRYEIPAYVGLQADYRLSDFRWNTPTPLDKGEEITVKPTRSNVPEKHKLVTLALRDRPGGRVAEFKTVRYKGYRGEKWVVNSAGHIEDARGKHLILDAGIDRLELEIEGAGWKRLEKTVAIPGDHDRTVEITMPESHRHRPLSGRVLDPDGRPVAGARVSLLGHRRFSKQLVSLNLRRITDDEGRFAFEHAPDECQMYVGSASPEWWIDTLPGWTEPIHVTANRREVLVKLKRSGDVKALLPDNFTLSGHFVRIYGVLSLDSAKAKEGEAQGQSCSLYFDRATRTLLNSSVRPGTYRLASRLPASRYDLDGIKGITIQVRGGEETVIDLRAGGRYPPRELPKVRTALLVEHEDQPVSGSLVRVFRRETPRWGGDERLVQIAADLSADTGLVFLDALPGRPHLAVARVHGKLVGWKQFTVRQEGTVTIALLPARTLVVRLDGPEPVGEHRRYDGRGVSLRVIGLQADESAALLRALDLTEPGWPASAGIPESPGRMLRDRRGVFSAFDLPVGRQYAIHVHESGDTLAVREFIMPSGDHPEHGIEILAPSRRKR